MKDKKRCLDCKIELKNVHFNTKRCEECVAVLRKRPLYNLNEKQQKQVLNLAGKMPREEIAKKIGASLSSVKRFARDSRVSLNYRNIYVKNEKLVKEVLKYYEKNGFSKTKKKFKKINIRTIVERYAKKHNIKPRQIPWTDDQFKELVKLAGLFSHENQAKYFNRPNAHRGSITSAWQKKIKVYRGSENINGMYRDRAKHFVKKSCPFLTNEQGRHLYLWSDMKTHLRADTPELIRKGIDAMAEFQQWLWESETPQKEVKKFIRKVKRKISGPLASA